MTAAKVGLGRAWQPESQATYMHRIASDLQSRSAWTGSLFDPPDPALDAVARVPPTA